jgi:hypothetical protein
MANRFVMPVPAGLQTRQMAGWKARRHNGYAHGFRVPQRGMHDCLVLSSLYAHR